MPMRKLLAIVALLCGAVSVNAAEPQKWCAEDGTVIIETAPNTFILDGRTLTSSEWELMDLDERDDGKNKLALVLSNTSRAFWPCP
jgi:hypothetical protein